MTHSGSTLQPKKIKFGTEKLETSTGTVCTSLSGRPTSSSQHLGENHVPPLTVILGLQPFAVESRSIQQNVHKDQCPPFNATLL